MTRKEYMDALERVLAFQPEGARQAALSFYGEMLDDRMEDGMTEEAAVAAMEAPEEIAGRIRAEGGADAEAQPEKKLDDDAMTFSTLAGNILSQVENALHSGFEAAEKTVEQNVRQAEKQVEEAVEKEEAGNTGDYQRKEFACPAGDVRAVRLLTENMPVVFRGWDRQDFRLVYYASERAPYRAELRQGVLTLENPEKKNIRSFSISFIGDHIHLMWTRTMPTVELYAPTDALFDLFIRTSNASVRGEELKALCSLEARTSNGRISLKKLSCILLDVQTSNSRLELERLKVRTALTGRSSNGRIEAEAVSAGADLSLTTSNARLTLNGVRAGKELQAHTSNSGIRAEKLQAEAVSLRTSNSAIHALLPGRQADWRIESSTSNGKNSLPRRQDGLRPLSVHTSNGNIDVHFEGEQA